MGVASGTVKTHLVRARSQIQINLRGRQFDEGDLS
jgi:DNA-directed RNA polymerase specialized sigma24 family protein